MKLDELKKMIQEEFESYMKEDDVDVSVGADDIDMDDKMDDMEGEASPEEALEKIYQMLKDYFESDGDDNDGDGVEDEEGEVPMEEAKEEIEEGDGYDGKAGKGNTGYDGKAGKGGTGYDAGSKALQERFQKLANIVKG